MKITIAILLFVYFLGVVVDFVAVAHYLAARNNKLLRNIPIALLVGALWPVLCCLYVFGIINPNKFITQFLEKYV